jgi:hypothetical protein
VNSPERVFVIKVADKKAQWIDVKRGRETDGKLEVFGDLSPGDHIVKTASEEIRDGSTIDRTAIINSQK